MIRDLKQRGFISFAKRNIIKFRSFFVGTLAEGRKLQFPCTSKALLAGVCYLCEICHRGFVSTRALADHERSKNHKKCLTETMLQITESNVSSSVNIFI